MILPNCRVRDDENLWNALKYAMRAFIDLKHTQKKNHNTPNEWHTKFQKMIGLEIIDFCA